MGPSLKRPSGLNVKELVLYEDNHLLVLNKPGGVLVQKDYTGDESLLEAAKLYLKEKYQKPGNVYLGLVHRLDRVTSGVIIFARTSKAARRLSEAFREGKVEKFYLALVEGIPKARGQLKGLLAWDSKRKKAYLDPSGKPAELSWLLFKRGKDRALLLINPKTGRKHQIRAQLAAAGHPIVGDIKYGSRHRIFGGRAILLHAWLLKVPHPTKKEFFSFKAPLPSYWPGKFYPNEGNFSPDEFAFENILR